MAWNARPRRRRNAVASPAGGGVSAMASERWRRQALRDADAGRAEASERTVHDAEGDATRALVQRPGQGGIATELILHQAVVELERPGIFDQVIHRDAPVDMPLRLGADSRRSLAVAQLVDAAGGEPPVGDHVLDARARSFVPLPLGAATVRCGRGRTRLPAHADRTQVLGGQTAARSLAVETRAVAETEDVGEEYGAVVQHRAREP